MDYGRNNANNQILDGSLFLWIRFCSVTVTDGMDTITQTTSISLENRSPILSNLVIESDGDIGNGSTLTCLADVTDADGESPAIVYNWILADGISTVEGDSLVLGNVSDGDVFTCTAYVEDANGASDSISDSIVIANINTPPVVDSVSLESNSCLYQ